MSVNIESLPPYLKCGECPYTHFLAVNRDIYGQWAIGYVEYAEGSIIRGLGLNNSATLKEAAERMSYAIQRWERRERPPTAGVR